MRAGLFDLVGLEFLEARRLKLQTSLDYAVDRTLEAQRAFLEETDPEQLLRRRAAMLRAAKWVGQLKRERNRTQNDIERRRRELMGGR